MLIYAVCFIGLSINNEILMTIVVNSLSCVLLTIKVFSCDMAQFGKFSYVILCNMCALGGSCSIGCSFTRRASEEFMTFHIGLGSSSSLILY